MLTLTRRDGEAVILTAGVSKIRVVVHETRNKDVRLGFEAPRHVAIRREELGELHLRWDESERAWQWACPGCGDTGVVFGHRRYEPSIDHACPTTDEDATTIGVALDEGQLRSLAYLLKGGMLTASRRAELLAALGEAPQ